MSLITTPLDFQLVIWEGGRLCCLGGGRHVGGGYVSRALVEGPRVASQPTPPNVPPPEIRV